MPVLRVECTAPRSPGQHAYHHFQGLLLEPVPQHPERGAMLNEHDVLSIAFVGQLRYKAPPSTPGRQQRK
jgi:hypothetical protein